MIVVEGTIRIKDLATAKPHMEAMIKASRAEAGCIDYAYAQDLLDPGLIRVHEQWVSRDALMQHLKTDHIAKWRACWPEIGISDRSLRLYEAMPEPF